MTLAGRLGVVEVRQSGIRLADNLIRTPRVTRWIGATPVGESGANYAVSGNIGINTVETETLPDGTTRYFGRRTVGVGEVPNAGQILRTWFAHVAIGGGTMNPAAGIPIPPGWTSLRMFYRRRRRTAQGSTTSIYTGYRWADAAGNWLTPSTPQIVYRQLPNDTWLVMDDTFPIPAGTAYVIVTAEGGAVTAPAEGDINDIADIMLTEGSYTGPYFDGYSPFAEWSGEPNNSPSTLYRQPPLRVETVEPRRQLITATNLATVPQVRNAPPDGGFGVNPAFAGGHVSVAWLSEPDGARTRYFVRRTALPTFAHIGGLGNYMSMADPGSVPPLPEIARLRMMPVTPGQRLNFSTMRRVWLASGATINLSVLLGTYDADLQRVSYVQNLGLVTITPTGDEWVRVTAGWTVTPNSAYLAVVWDVRPAVVTSVVGGDWSDIADVLITTADPVPDYFDGDSPDAAWLGAPNNSRSARLGLAAPLGVVAASVLRET